jgi:hypothetical protein
LYSHTKTGYSDITQGVGRRRLLKTRWIKIFEANDKRATVTSTKEKKGKNKNENFISVAGLKTGMRKRRRREEEESLLVCSSSGTSQISSTLVCFIRDGHVDRMFIPNLSVFHFLPGSKQAGRQTGSSSSDYPCTVRQRFSSDAFPLNFKHVRLIQSLTHATAVTHANTRFFVCVSFLLATFSLLI